MTISSILNKAFDGYQSNLASNTTTTVLSVPTNDTTSYLFRIVYRCISSTNLSFVAIKWCILDTSAGTLVGGVGDELAPIHNFAVGIPTITIQINAPNLEMQITNPAGSGYTLDCVVWAYYQEIKP